MDERSSSTAPQPALQAAACLLAVALAAASGAAGAAAASAEEGIELLQPGLAKQVRQLALDGSRQWLSGGKAGRGAEGAEDNEGADKGADGARSLRAAGSAGPARGAEGAAASARRVEIHVGALNPRLRLAPCQRIEPYLAAGTALWGKTRIGLRCAQGSTPWNVFLPVTVSVFGAGWVAAAPLPAGSVLAVADLARAEVDLAEDGAAVTELQMGVGRTLARALNAGQPLRSTDLKLRQWFAAGDDVKVASRGHGFSVAGSGQALNHGLEGQPVRVRAESGRVLVGMPVGERLVELPP